MCSLESAQPLYTFEAKNNCDPASVVRVAPLLHKCTTQVGTPARYVQSSRLPTSEKQNDSKKSRGRKCIFFCGRFRLAMGDSTSRPPTYSLHARAALVLHKMQRRSWNPCKESKKQCSNIKNKKRRVWNVKSRAEGSTCPAFFHGKQHIKIANLHFPAPTISMISLTRCCKRNVT